MGFHDDDALRSEFVRHLLLAEAADLESAPKIRSSIPKVLIRFWHDSEDLPNDVGECLATWEPLRQRGFDILTFDDTSAAAYIKASFGPLEVEAFKRCRHPAMRSDYFRMCYLVSSGGLYVDADDVLTGELWPTLYVDDRLKLQPLCYDIPSGAMVSASEMWRSRASASE